MMNNKKQVVNPVKVNVKKMDRCERMLGEILTLVRILAVLWISCPAKTRELDT